MTNPTPFQVFDRNYQEAQLRLQPSFTYHPPANNEVVETYAAIRAHGNRLAAHIMAVQPESHELIKAIDAIREAIMWANAGIALNGITIPSPEDPDDIQWESQDEFGL